MTSPARKGPPSGADWRGATSVAQWLDKAAAFLSERGVPESRANAEFLLAHVLKASRTELALRRTQVLTVRQANEFWHLALKRGRRQPLAYVLGHQPFLGLDFRVEEGSLVPRPETEELVAEAIRRLEPRAREPLQILEIGTGTGCIAVSLARRFPHAAVWATDISPQALALALKNAETHHVSSRIRFVREDLFRPETGAARRGWADLVISNPPYVPSGEIDGLEEEVRREPREALDGGRDGLDAIRAIVAEAPRHLKPGGWLALEIGSGQGAAVRRLLAEAGLDEAEVRRDAQGHERMALGRMKS